MGYVTPSTGPLAGMAEADNYVLDIARRLTAGGIRVGNTTRPVEFLVRDSQSDPNRAAEVARQLIVNDGVRLMLVASTPETTNPVSTVAEQEEVPLISTMAPWQPWYFGRQANPGNPQPFDWTYHFFWGQEGYSRAIVGIWDQIQTNRISGGLWPNDADGNALGDPMLGVPADLRAAGYQHFDPGRYTNLNTNFTAQINYFRQNNAELLIGVMLPPDATTFWQQTSQQGYRPPVASLAKALLFPVSVESIGPSAHNLSTEVWWTPDYPFTSALTGATGPQLAQGFTAFTGRPWTQPIGFIHALFEVAIDVLNRSSDPTDYDANRDAIRATNVDTIVGNVNWSHQDLGPVISRNVVTTPVVGGQWRFNGSGFNLVIVSNPGHPDIPLGGAPERIV